MIHSMKLLDREFHNIKNNNKRVEVRLSDEKRQKIIVGDQIIFSNNLNLNESILVTVVGISVFDNFEELYSQIPESCFGYNNLSMEQILDNIYSIYSKEQEKEYGVVAIEFELNKNI